MDYTVDSFVGKMIKAVICISIVMMASGALFFRSSYAIGFTIGVGMSMVLNLIKIKWLEHCVKRATTMEQGSATAYISINYLLRYVLTGAVLAAAHFLPFADMFGAAIGLLAMPFSNYVVHFFKRRGESGCTAQASDEDVIEGDIVESDAVESGIVEIVESDISDISEEETQA